MLVRELENRIVSVLYWCTDKGLFSSFHSARSWAYAGQEHVCLRFSLPRTRGEIKELRLVLLPFPGGACLKSIRLTLDGVSTTHDDLHFKVKRAIGIEGRSSRGMEPPLEALSVTPDEDLGRKLSKGVIVDLTVTFFENSHPQPDKQPEFKDLPDKDSVSSRHMESLNAELRTFDLIIKDVYSSNSWTYTRWCRELLAEARGQALWGPLVLLVRLVKSLCSQISSSRRTPSSPVRMVDIVVPVFNGLDNLRTCLDSVRDSATTVPYSLVVVDDASTDPAVSNYLSTLESEGRIILLKNDTNSDFTRTVQRGMDLHSDRDVVLLNSDTKVAHDWLGRMQRAAYSEDAVGTVTPFSNNASIYSYPRIEGNCDVPDRFELEEIDEMFSRLNSGSVVEIPTAVGFCMYIKRSCLERVGNMDDFNFPGYGGEDDFCMWASNVGMKNVLAADTFVYHEGGATYKNTSGSKRNKAYRKLLKIHPEFQANVDKFVQSDPLRGYRENIDLERLKRATKPVILLILHGLAGGTELHVKQLVKHFQDRVDFLCLRPVGEHLQVRWMNENEGLTRVFHGKLEFGDLISFLESLPIARIHIHHALGLETGLSRIVSLLQLPFDFTVHDFYAACPRGWLCDDSGQYCGQPDEAGCNACLSGWSEQRASSIEDWRKKFAWMIEEAQRVFVPSLDAHERLSRYFRPRPYIITPHLDCQNVRIPEPVSPVVPTGERLRVVVLGLLNTEKGADTLEACAIDAVERDLPVEFHFLGGAYRPLAGRPEASLISYGLYNDADILEILAQVRPHLAWFPARCPETYSYTLSACLKAGLPVAAPNLGAFPERLHGREWSWVLPWETSQVEWNDFFARVLNENFATGQSPPPPVARAGLVTKFVYDQDYCKPLLLTSGKVCVAQDQTEAIESYR